MIRRYGILNEQVKPGDLILYGIPYPGAYITDGDGIVVSKSFHGSYKIRDSPEALLDAATVQRWRGGDEPRGALPGGLAPRTQGALGVAP